MGVEGEGGFTPDGYETDTRVSYIMNANLYINTNCNSYQKTTTYGTAFIAGNSRDVM